MSLRWRHRHHLARGELGGDRVAGEVEVRERVGIVARVAVAELAAHADPCVKPFIIGTISASFVSFGRTRRFDGGLNGDCSARTKAAADTAATQATSAMNPPQVMLVLSMAGAEHILLPRN